GSADEGPAVRHARPFSGPVPPPGHPRCRVRRAASRQQGTCPTGHEPLRPLGREGARLAARVAPGALDLRAARALAVVHRPPARRDRGPAGSRAPDPRGGRSWARSPAVLLTPIGG